MDCKLLDAINAVNEEGKINSFSYAHYYEALSLSAGTILFVEPLIEEHSYVLVPKKLNYFCESFFGSNFTYKDFRELCPFITWVHHDSVSIGILPYLSFELFLTSRNLLDIFIKNKPKDPLSLF